MKTASKKATEKHSTGIISDKIKNYNWDPFVLKKGKASEDFLTKNGFPKELLEKK